MRTYRQVADHVEIGGRPVHELQVVCEGGIREDDPGVGNRVLVQFRDDQGVDLEAPGDRHRQRIARGTVARDRVVRRHRGQSTGSAACRMHQRTPVGSEDDLHFLFGNDISPGQPGSNTVVKGQGGGRLDVAALRYPDCQIARDTPRGWYDEQNRIAALNGILRGNGECASGNGNCLCLPVGQAAWNLAGWYPVRVAGFREVQNARRHARINLAFAQAACGQCSQRLSPRFRRRSGPFRPPSFRCRYGPA